jgi:hypothetical protein
MTKDSARADELLHGPGDTSLLADFDTARTSLSDPPVFLKVCKPTLDFIAWNFSRPEGLSHMNRFRICRNFRGPDKKMTFYDG